MPDRDPALASFAAQVAALREAREEQLPVRVGVLVPTFNRPDLVRSCALQLASQSRAPDVICIHQNGHPDSYQWAVDDLRTPSKLQWLHTPGKLFQHDWYAIPLQWLLDDGCTHFFWADHDDLYFHDHIEAGLADLQAHDFSVSSHCGLLFTKTADFRFGREVEFTSHAPGGASSTMCFTRKFARELLADIAQDNRQTTYTDNIVAHVTMPKFKCLRSSRNTCAYHSHEGSLTSHQWLQAAFA